MRRAGNLIERIADADNLRLAFWKASRGKRTRAAVRRFGANLDAELRHLRDDLLAGAVRWGPYHTFYIHDPKERLICAAPFRDRVAHHTIINVAEPVFESYQIHDSYACRKGKGLDAAIRRAIHFSCAGHWYLKLDVRRYFDSVDHRVLNSLLRRRFKDRTVLELFAGIVDSHHSTPGYGLPLGNLTSQFFANHYLRFLDHFVKDVLRCRRYVRYMDDLVFWGKSRVALRRIGTEAGRFLKRELSLELKPVCLNQCSRGMTFLGYRVFPGRVRLARRSRDRFRRKLRQCHANLESGFWDEAETARHVQSLVAFVRRAESVEYRRRVLADMGLCPKEARTA